MVIINNVVWVNLVKKNPLNIYISNISGALSLSSAFFGEGDGDILFHGVQCHSNESRLVDCQRSSEHYRCSHKSDAGVRCPGMLEE